MNIKRSPLVGSLAIVAIVYLSTPYVDQLSFHGVLDTLTGALFVLAGCQLFFLIPGRLAVICVSLFIFMAMVFNFASGEYFQLQQYYPTLQSAYLLKEIWSLLAAYSYWQLLMLFVVGLCGLVLFLILAIYAQPSSIRVKIIASFLLLMTSLGFQWGYAANVGMSFSVIDSSPLSHFVRSAGVIPFGAENVENAERYERDAVIRAMMKDQDLPLPSRYSADSLSGLLGYGADYKTRISSPRYPLYKRPVQVSKNNRGQYNVIVLVLESVRASEMGVYGAAESATPFLDSLVSKATFAKKFYATGNYTVKSEHAIHCSAMDRFIGSPLAESPGELKTVCLPALLKKEGYTSYWFHGNEVSFYNRSEYLPKLGFQNIYDADSLNADGSKESLGWGISDVDLLPDVEKILSSAKEPFYAEVLTLSNHLPFDYDWGIEFPDYLADDDTFHQRYRRGIYYTDQAIKGFYRLMQRSGLLDRTILLITGDHGVWSFADENLPGVQKNEQMFRVPLFVQVPDREPVTIEGNHSHLDIAPTIVDLLGLSSSDDFMGQSIFTDNSSKAGRVIYSMSENAVSYRFKDLMCIPSVQCTNDIECYSVLEQNKQSSICYDLPSNQDLLLDGSVALSKRSASPQDRALFGYSQIAVEIGSFPPDK